VGEQGVLGLVQSFCPSDVVGDDGAIAALLPGHQLVVTTDVLVDEVHFSDRTTSPEDVGWRAAAVNLSDLAAMGATPIGLTVGLSMPPSTELDWIKGIYRGLKACLDRYGGQILGGDVTRSQVATIAVTALGQVLPERIIQRSHAQPGDAIVVTGPHGRSRAGLELLLKPELCPSLHLEQKELFVMAHRRPRPRFDVLPYLTNYERIAGMDSSDGLADAVIQICRASGVGAIIDYHLLPGLNLWLPWQQPTLIQEWQLYGGEDFELVLALPRSQAEELITTLTLGATIIGEIRQGADITMINGVNGPINLKQSQSYQHFKDH
jgi:thiamine-monophosphate kinase